MNVYTIAAALFTATGIVPLLMATRGGRLHAILALEVAAPLAAMAMLLWAQSMRAAAIYDIPLLLAILSLGGVLIFMHALERWI